MCFFHERSLEISTPRIEIELEKLIELSWKEKLGIDESFFLVIRRHLDLDELKDKEFVAPQLEIVVRSLDKEEIVDDIRETVESMEEGEYEECRVESSAKQSMELLEEYIRSLIKRRKSVGESIQP